MEVHCCSAGRPSACRPASAGRAVSGQSTARSEVVAVAGQCGNATCRVVTWHTLMGTLMAGHMVSLVLLEVMTG